MFSHDDFFNLDTPEAFAVNYWPQGGCKIPTIAFIDEGVEIFPGGFESGVIERGTEITFRKDHVQSVTRGDTVTTENNETYTIKDTIDDDGFSIRVSVT